MTAPTIYETFQKELLSRGYSPETIPGYKREVSNLVWHFQRMPDAITGDEIREYLVHLAFNRGRSRPGMVSAISALRAFFRYVLRWSETTIREVLPTLFTPKTEPEIYSPDEIERLLGVRNLRIAHQAMLTTLYAAGLRVEEVCNLKVSDIQSQWMHIRVAPGDGPERMTPLSRGLLVVLRNYWRACRPALWLFPSPRSENESIHPQSLHRTFARAIKASGLPNRGIQALRHSFAVHMLALGVDLPTLQRYLGHRWPLSTDIYVHLMRKSPNELRNPLGLLRPCEPATNETEAQ